MYLMRCPQPTTLINIEADVLQVSLPPGVLWQDLQRTALRWPARSGHVRISSHPNVLLFPCALLHQPPLVISCQAKAVGHFSPVFQQCRDLSCQRTWLLHPMVTPRVMNNNNEDTCYNCSSARLFFYFFFIPPWTLIVTTAGQKTPNKTFKDHSF